MTSAREIIIGFFKFFAGHFHENYLSDGHLDIVLQEKSDGFDILERDGKNEGERWGSEKDVHNRDR